MKKLLLFAAIAALAATQVGAQYYPNARHAQTNYTALSVPPASAVMFGTGQNTNGVLTNQFVILRQDHGQAFLWSVAGTNANTPAIPYTFYTAVTDDLTNFTTGSAFTFGGTTSSSTNQNGYTNIASLYLNNVRAVMITGVSNAATASGGGANATNVLTVNFVDESHSNQ